MKRLLAIVMAASAPMFAAETNGTAVLKDAIAKLKAETNYSWTVKVELPSMGFTPEPMQGKTEKDGYTLLTQDFNGALLQAAIKGGKAALKVEDAWQAADAVDQGAMNGWWLAQVKPGAEEAADLVVKAKELKPGADGLWSGDFTETGARDLLSFGRRPGATDGPPPPKNAKGTVKFWVKDGELIEFESHVQGSVAFAADQDPQDMNMIRTAEMHDQGKTKVEVPAEARAKLQAK